MPSAVETLAFWRDPHAYLRWCRQRYGSTFTMTPLAKPPLVFMSDADDIRAIVSAPADVLLPGEGGAVIAPLVGRDSFMLADGDDHLAGRRAILPGFQRQRVSAHTDMVSTTVAAEIETWPLGEPVALGGRLRALTLRVILHTIFGAGDERVDELHRRLLAMFQVAGTLTLHMPVLKHAPPWRRVWRRFLADRESVDASLAELIVERAHSRAHDRGLLGMLIGPRHVAGGADAIGEVRDTIMSLILAGHETTGSELAWSVQLLAHHPAARQRLIAELDGGSDDYLGAVVSEVLRHRPVFLFTIPRVVAQPYEIGGRTYRPPVHLVGCVHLMQHDAELYRDPEAFCPERFLDEAPSAAAWMPWGGGRKTCPGRHLALVEMCTVLRALFEHLDIEPANARVETGRWRTVIVAPGKGCRVVLRERGAKSVRRTAQQARS
ncbi:MAG TPA: cytochrome P450 [Solirubrobacteraceae bacterium]|nr:cytochrome P450 [Solirubrobacteraceae bacterium]